MTRALRAVSAPAVPARFNFAGDVLYRRAELTPARIATLAIHADGSMEAWSYARIAAASKSLASAMARAGLKQGDRVLLVMPRTPHWQVAMAACMHLGAVPVPCVTQITAPELAYRAQKSGAAGAISDRRLLDKFASCAGLHVRFARGGGDGWRDLEEAMAAPDASAPLAVMPADAPALMYFTSGSSGPPKAVLHAARGIYVRAYQPWRQLAMGEDDVIWTTSDTGWTRAGSCLVFGAWMHGAAALMMEEPPPPEARVDVLEACGVTFFGAVTTELRIILGAARKRPLPKLRWTLSAGEAMTAEMAARWQEFSGVPLLVGYGQSETPTATLTDPAAPAVNGMIGRPMAGNQVAVVDAEGRECAPGVHGSLAFGATDPGLMLGYWETGTGRPGEDGAARLELLAGRWHLSGDCGTRDADGNLYFVGRDDDVISSAGYRIGPTEVENALSQHPSVAECAVVASPDGVRGEVVKAYVVLRPGQRGGEALAASLQDYVKRQIAPYKYPRKMQFVDSLPRTASGKILRRALREIEFNAPKGDPR